ncbi:major facilitator superfamily domain-containing 6-like [Micractinium conductrix]|uniref:Major facilitator superfamily domain-containing 6-like n=1 Tax=Micractinium conductrix TaxID=554055 RepID=A0A2P6VRC6_9CHLO|nr:major facilitator superfamily domain-containing 6-like [Micractinium conductrix]|eukprot:PSC76656.1 major facilitator superfamily domain-containing 6-like [Micractinium conductrix]
MFLAEHGGGELLMGAVLTANSLPELPAFFFFGAIMQALGMQTLLLSAAAALGLRIWAYSLLPAVGLRYVVLLETLHAITYACGWSGCAVNSSKIAPPGLESTTQGLFQGLWTGVGCGLAGLLGGILYGSHGPIVLFRVSGLAILGCTAAAGVPMLVVHRRRKAAVARDLLPSPESLADLASLGQ